MTTSPASLSDFVAPGTPNGDASRFQPYTFAQAQEDAKRIGSGFSTGFRELDARDFRFVRGKLYAVLGRPGEGKTSVLLEMAARHAAYLRSVPSKQLGPAVFVTYEETLLAIYLRLVKREIGRSAIEHGQRPPVIPRRVLERWLVGASSYDALEGHWDTLMNAADIIDHDVQAGRLVLVDGDGAMGPVDQLVSFLRTASADAAPSLVAVDYFQKIRPALGSYYRSQQEQFQETADVLRRYAKGEPLTAADPRDHRIERPVPAAQPVPLVVGSQVNREAVSAEGATEPPELHHIRGGDDLANDASGVLTLCRPNDELKMRIAKNRDGKRGETFSLGFDGPTQHVYDLESGRSGVKIHDDGLL